MANKFQQGSFPGDRVSPNKLMAPDSAFPILTMGLHSASLTTSSLFFQMFPQDS